LLSSIPIRAALALHPLCVAQDLGWCDHDDPRWGEHTSESMPTIPPCSAHRLQLYGRSPLLHGALALRFALRTMGERPTYAPPSPSLLISKHRPSVKKSSIWARKKSPIWGMCLGLPRNYNQINRQAGCPQRLPPSQSGPAFLLSLAAVLDRAVLNFARTGFSEVRALRIWRWEPKLRMGRPPPRLECVR
jgi:hypothetical protein